MRRYCGKHSACYNRNGPGYSDFVYGDFVVNQTEEKLLQEIVRGAELIFENAQKLYEEAQLLGTNGAFARALTLHQISMEECSKVDMLGAAAMSLLMGDSLNLDKLATAFRQHKVKNYNNAYMSVTTDAEREARKRSDFTRAIQIFKAQQAEIHRELNANKNASLYVDYCDGKFVSPSERITEELATQFQQLNGFFLSHGATHLHLLSKVASDPAAVAVPMQELASRLAQLNASAGDLDEKFEEIVGAWIEEQSVKAREISGEP